MPDIALEAISVSKKFRKGESFGSLRDFIPAIVGKSFGRGRDDSLGEKEFWALRDLSFQVKRGQALGIIGHNGAGKSTLLKLLSRIMKPTSGSIVVNGKLSALIEVGAGFHSDLTGRENIFLNGVILGMSRAEIARKFDEIVEFSGLREFIDTPVKRYSSGMYARLGFSVAAHVNPDIFLVDEVLSVGDWTFQSKGAEKMEELMNGGVTVVFVSHNLRAIARLCDECVLLKQGTVLKTGPSEEVIRFYLDSESQVLGESPKGKLYISKMSVTKDGEKQERFRTGEKVLVSVTIKAERPCNDLALHVYIYDENFYNVFQTSTELLGYGDILLREGDEREVCVELCMHLGMGVYHFGAVARSKFHGGLEQYDRKFPGATIFIDAPGSMNGPANLYPKLVCVK